MKNVLMNFTQGFGESWAVIQKNFLAGAVEGWSMFWSPIIGMSKFFKRLFT